MSLELQKDSPESCPLSGLKGYMQVRSMFSVGYGWSRGMVPVLKCRVECECVDGLPSFIEAYRQSTGQPITSPDHKAEVTMEARSRQ